MSASSSSAVAMSSSSASAPSLCIPDSTSQSPERPPQPDPTPYPAFLRLSKADIKHKYDEAEKREQRRVADPGDEFVRCSGDIVYHRNRYGNVDPYERNRVRLQVPEGHDDYINASPIHLELTKSKKKITFIATQGPTSDTYSHIWRMIWNETASEAVVVMLTKTRESGRNKCYAYYPTDPANPDLNITEDNEFGDGLSHVLHLASLTEDEEASTQVRELALIGEGETGSETKKIWHLLFEAWPDFNVPEGANRTALLNMIRLSRDKNPDNETNPRIVHCSAGVGRSGTFIALDWLLEELEEGSLDEVPDQYDPITAVIEQLRQQRMMMVQGELQFAFLYDVLRERWRERWIRTHPAEAEQLGLTTTEEPAAKRAKTNGNAEDAGDAGEGYADGAVEGDEDLHAELEAELASNQLDFEQGR